MTVGNNKADIPNLFSEEKVKKYVFGVTGPKGKFYYSGEKTWCTLSWRVQKRLAVHLDKVQLDSVMNSYGYDSSQDIYKPFIEEIR